MLKTYLLKGPARVDLPGAVVDDEISDRDSSEVGSLSSPSPPQVIILQCEHTDGLAQKKVDFLYIGIYAIYLPPPLHRSYFFARTSCTTPPRPSVCAPAQKKKDQLYIQGL